jgi:preprotein translocase subunit SecY
VLTRLKLLFTIRDLRSKLLFTVLMVSLFRIGVVLQAPGIDQLAAQQLHDAFDNAGVLGFLNLISGGALGSFSIFALGVTPYITASIIMQILPSVSERVAELRDAGSDGAKTLTQWTRYLTLGLAAAQAAGLTWLFGTGRAATAGTGVNTPGIVLLPDMFPAAILVAATLTVGAVVVMFIGEQITRRGLGNGPSVLVFAGIAARLPYSYVSLAKLQPILFGVLLVVSLWVLLSVVVVELGVRRIQVAHSRGGNRAVAKSFIPMKVNQAGVTPIILASSMIAGPAVLLSLMSAGSDGNGWRAGFGRFASTWLTDSGSASYLALFALLVIAFTWFAARMQFDPDRQAKQLAEQGSYIPGFRPGSQTAAYLGRVLGRLTMIGAVFVTTLALLPYVLLLFSGEAAAAFPFAGTSVMIAVGVTLEMVRQADALMMVRSYDGFLAKARRRRR